MALLEIRTEEVIKRYCDGETVYSIAKSFGVAQPTIIYRLKKAGVYSTTEEHIQKNKQIYLEFLLWMKESGITDASTEILASVAGRYAKSREVIAEGAHAENVKINESVVAGIDSIDVAVDD